MLKHKMAKPDVRKSKVENRKRAEEESLAMFSKLNAMQQPMKTQ